MAKQTHFAVPSHIAQQVEVQDGARAVEVSALFDDAVLEVRHLDDPAGGKVSRVTKGALGTGAAALGGLFLLFAGSYAQVASEKAAAEANPLAAKHRPESPARDVAAAGLLGYGAGALVYGLYRLRSERKENEFTIGADPRASFQVDVNGLSTSRFPLVRSTGTDYELLYSPALEGEVETQGKSIAIKDLVASGAGRPSDLAPGAVALPIPEDAKFRLRAGQASFLVSSVARPRQYPAPIKVDWGTQSYTAAVLGGVGVMMALMFSVPPDPKSLALDAFLNERITRIQLTPPVQPEETAKWLEQQKQVKENGGGKAAKDKSGVMGSQTAAKVQKSFAIKGPKDNMNPELAKQAAREAAQNMGVIGIIRASNNAALASITGRESALGRDAQNAMGNLMGLEMGDAYGVNGMGMVGSQRGGDGTGDGTIGVGPLGTIGHGPGTPGFSRMPPGAKLKEHVTKGPSDWSLGPPVVVGSLDKELIRRVIRQHMSEVKFCYEKELTRNQTLSGRVQVQFAITSTGTVATSMVEQSTLGNPQAESCIAGAVHRWVFPKPQGGIVIVHYPFVLKTAGE